MSDAPDNAQPCFHCGLPVMPGVQFFAKIDGVDRAMCCPGCQAVATAIADGGLSRFYQYRQSVSEKPAQTQDDFAIYDLAQLQAEFVLPISDGAAAALQANLILQGVTCAACGWLIEQHLLSLEGVSSVSVSVTSHRAHIVFYPEQIRISQIMSELAAVGYRPLPATDEQRLQYEAQQNRTALVRLGVAGFGMMQAGMVAVGLYTGAGEQWLTMLRWLSLLLSTPVVFFSGLPFFQAAWRSLRAGQLVMDVPVSLAILIGYFASLWATVTGTGEVYFESIAMFVFLLLVGRYLEMRSRTRGRVGRTNVAQLIPAVARRWQDGQWQQVPVTLLEVGDRVRIDAGQNIPADGSLIQGQSAVNEALVTGESRPVSKSVGQGVIAGSENIDSPIEIRVEAVGGATRLSAIERLVVQAESEKPRRLVLADRIARHFVAAVLVVCSCVFAVWWVIAPERALWIALSVLVVTCPCALALAMPTALTVATEALRKNGVLVTRGHVLDTLPGTTQVVFDKTGTLTTGHLSVTDVGILRRDIERDAVLALAAALEQGSQHPVARAFDAWQGKCNADTVRQFVGRGVTGNVGGREYRLGRPEFVAELSGSDWPDTSTLPDGYLVYLGDNDGVLAWIALDDPLRPEASELMQALRAKSIRVSLLSGDGTSNVARVAKQLGLDEYVAEASPEGKLDYLKAQQAKGEIVAMVGDGINDVPVLAQADVSIAMSRASDLAAVHADVLLLSDGLQPVTEALLRAEKTRRIIIQNLSLSVVYNLLALPLAACGLIAPWAAAIGMTTSSLLVVLNALRLNS